MLSPPRQYKNLSWPLFGSILFFVGLLFLIPVKEEEKLPTQHPTRAATVASLPVSTSWMNGLFAFNNIPYDYMNGKLVIPKEKKRIKLDVGNSVNAPNSALWLRKDPTETIVYAFEPNPFSVAMLNSGKAGNFYSFANILDSKHLWKDFFQMKVAIGDENKASQEFFMTEGDPGTSSLNEPTAFKLQKTVPVPVIRLDYFLDKIPWDQFKYVDVLKTDTQGFDLKAIKGAGKYLREKIVCVNAEFMVTGYKSVHRPDELQRYLAENGFKLLAGETWVNSQFEDLVKTKKVDCEVEGL